MIPLMLEGLALGLSMGVHCAITCSPFIIPYLATSSSPTLWDKLRIFSQFIFGRLFAYIVFAIVATIVGKRVEKFLSPQLEGIVFVAASIFLLTFLIFNVKREHKHDCQKVKKFNKYQKSMPFFTGFVLGVHICPAFLIALFKVITIGSFYKATLYFLSLFIGSTIYMLPVPFVTELLAHGGLKRVGTYLGFLVSIWFLIQGVVLL